MMLGYPKRLLKIITTPLVGNLIFVNVAYAASDTPAISLDNTNFVVSLAFIAFLALLIYLKVPSKISKMLDDRSKSIEDEIQNANSILEESKMMLAELEREHKTNIEKAKKIVTDAETEAKNILAEAKKEVRRSIERKVKAAEDQIKTAEELVIKSIKEKAIDKSISKAESELLSLAKTKINRSSTKEAFKEVELGLKRL